ncbi:MAG: hypothetical protein H6741_16140 [Alphaproteobacteria bacterium]|nr:hypothetical protein [Alphaproteobacteria bacterium]MCB9794244.1 hypothetical protein [Alphaproteobacteria bacterium]
MILVTGTGRSGTSLWMQILEAAGLPVLGEAFPERYTPGLEAANPRGFHETCLIHGINFSTNPHPLTGAYLDPAQTKDWAVKVLSFGLHRTEKVYLDRVLLTVRSWRSFGPSLERLIALEGGLPDTETPPDPALYWFSELHACLQDAWRRGYPLHTVSFERCLSEPHTVIPEVLTWLERPADLAAAVAVVEPRLSDAREDPREDLPAHWTQTFDDLYAQLAAGRPWGGELSRRCAALAQEISRSAGAPR